jgi:hypothetical protein
VWVEIKAYRIYSCYFSPNDEISKFEHDINALELSVRSSRKELIITGDLNSKSSAWGESRSDRRGDVVCEFLAANDLILLNRGNEPTFHRGSSSSIIDLTLATPAIAKTVKDWAVLDAVTLSDHMYIEYHLTGETSKLMCAEQDRRNPGWHVKKMDKNKLVSYLNEAKIIADMGWVYEPCGLESYARSTKGLLIEACNTSMPKRSLRRSNRLPVFWWTAEIANLRRICNICRRRWSRMQGNEELKSSFKKAKKHLQRAIKESKETCWKNLLRNVEYDTWGAAYKIVTKNWP